MTAATTQAVYTCPCGSHGTLPVCPRCSQPGTPIVIGRPTT
jgi:hypothetical protein